MTTGIVVLAVLVTAFVFLLPSLTRAPIAQPEGEAEVGDPRARIEAGRRALTDGMFNQAQREFDAAAAIRERRRDALSPTEARRLAQLQRQTALLTGLIGKSLQDILQEAALVRAEEEWQARFKQDYFGKSVIFDDTVRRDAAGRPTLAHYTLRVGEQSARVALEDVKLLSELPLESPQRLVFGVRLAAVSREPGGGWVIRLDPDSGVLLTDPSAAAGCCPAPLDDAFLGLLQRQADWMDR